MGEKGSFDENVSRGEAILAQKTDFANQIGKN
jgi:hypothetical protein